MIKCVRNLLDIHMFKEGIKMQKKSLKVTVILLLISIIANTSYGFSMINGKDIGLITFLTNRNYFINPINNTITRYKIAESFGEEHEALKESILIGQWNQKHSPGMNLFSPISKNEIVHILNEYASLKKLEIKTLDNFSVDMNGSSTNDINTLLTGNILTRDFIIDPLTIDSVKDGVDRINELTKEKEIIIKEVMAILEGYNQKLERTEQISFNLVHGQTGAKVSYNGAVKSHPASIIKTLYLYVFLKEVDVGKRSLDDERVFLEEDKFNGSGRRIGGSGILQGARSNVTYTWGELLRLMIINSDNVATSMVMRELGSETIHQRAEKLGLENTLITGPIYTKAGVPTRSTPEDLTKILYLIDTLPIGLRDFALKQMKDCHSKDRIATELGHVKWLGNKTGTLSDYVGDSAIIRYGEKPNTIYMTFVIRTIDDSYINILKSEKRISKISSDILDKLESISITDIKKDSNYRNEYTKRVMD